jgi:hypothetical protein
MEYQAVAKALMVLPLLAVQARRRVTAGEWGERRSVFIGIELGSTSCSLPIRGAPQTKHLIFIPHGKAYSVHCSRLILVSRKDEGSSTLEPPIWLKEIDARATVEVAGVAKCAYGREWGRHGSCGDCARSGSGG